MSAEKRRAVERLQALRFAEQDARVRTVHASESYVQQGLLTSWEAAAALGISRASWFRLREWARDLTLS